MHCVEIYQGNARPLPSIYSENTNTTRLNPRITELLSEATEAAQEQLGTVQRVEDEGSLLPVKVRKMSVGGKRGVYVYLNSDEDRSTPAIAQPLKWVAGLASGLVLPIISFCLGKDLARAVNTERDLGRLAKLKQQEFPYYREARARSYEFHCIEKVVDSWMSILGNMARHRQVALAAKTIMAVGATMAVAAAYLSGVATIGAFAGAPLFLLGTCLLWGEWGYQMVQQPQMNRLAENMLQESQQMLLQQQ